MTPALPDGDTTYRALFCELRTDQVVDVLPLTGTEFDDYIGKPGQLRATVPLPDEELARRARAALRPGRTAVWLERGPDIWWGGILWTCTPSGDERGRLQVEFQAGTFDSYLDHRFLSSSQQFKAEDQLEIARKLVQHVQAQPGGGIGITYGTESSAVRWDRTYAYTDLARVRELIDQLAGLQNGFEWRIQCYRDPVTGRRTKRLQLGHPVIRGGAADIVLDRPGQILTYSLPADSAVQANVWVARGDTTGGDQAAGSLPQMSDVAVSQPDLDDGWPRLEGSSDHSGVTDKRILNSAAAGELARARSPQVIPELTVRVAGAVTPALIGSTVRVRIRDGWHNGEPDRRYRVVGLSVTPPDRGKSETAKLFLEEVR
ncbi:MULTISPECIES: hypothetical protein [Streptomyces]|uniref:hypothetical protein n=1 Tax=Streptomyces TaxID=1883 RepID=UPI00163D1E8D|nr:MULTISPECIES: hypothetical protein [Streptomyces]MBC2877433.1 hypothetical protein [Streptomyces sp. TYQ1024]UBI38231.1 hypothetical protein K7I03_18415 [Streptomyces mobaraensis]UKW30817.1 hypothetical protein MCU78_18375 [Streptomyces sp. TYQ1024]